MSNRVTVKVDAGKTTGEQEHLWRWIGYDECNYTYIPEGKELLRKFAALEDAPLLCENPFYVLHGQLPRNLQIRFHKHLLGERGGRGGL